MEQELRGKAAIVTGAASGIGRAAAIEFARRGARVLLADWDSKGGEESARHVKSKWGEAAFFKCDVSDAKQAAEMVQKAIVLYGRLDCAFNNAGIEGDPAPAHECREENWDRVLKVNLKGVWLCMKFEIAEMLKRGGGAIVNNSSIAGLVGFAGMPAYVASKHGILGLTKTAALEYAKSAIRINAVCPGVIKTPMIDRFTKGDAAALRALEASEPVGRAGRPEEAARCAAWLCSEEASFVTGHALTVDGGWVAQ